MNCLNKNKQRLLVLIGGNSYKKTQQLFRSFLKLFKQFNKIRVDIPRIQDIIKVS